MPQKPETGEPTAPGDAAVPTVIDELDELEPLEVEEFAVSSPTIDPSIAVGGMVASAGGRRRRFGWGAWLAVVWLAAVTFSAIFANFLPLEDPEISDFSSIATGPSSDHLLGTDQIGRDILARLIFGARVALVVGVVAVGIGMIVGGIIGLLAGHYRGRLEAVLMAFADIMLSFPALVFLIAIVVFRGRSLTNICVAIGIIAIPAFARITRASTLAFSQREFVMAARAMGAKNRRIIFREVFPNVILPVTAFALVVVAVAIVAEGGLAFLGLSVPQPQPSWGNMIADGRSKLNEGIAHISLIPAFAMFLTVLSFNMLGDRFRTLFDVRESRL
jgi:peptide/nickel transport system permease protein